MSAEKKVREDAKAKAMNVKEISKRLIKAQAVGTEAHILAVTKTITAGSEQPFDFKTDATFAFVFDEIGLTNKVSPAQESPFSELELRVQKTSDISFIPDAVCASNLFGNTDKKYSHKLMSALTIAPQKSIQFIIKNLANASRTVTVSLNGIRIAN
jgi:hypothetical protein